MCAVHRKIAVGFFAVLAIALVLFAVAPASASQPVPRTIAGCVFSGSFTSSDGYNILPMHTDGRKVDLRPFEGRAIIVTGALLPGDVLIVNELPLDSGPCATMTFSPPRVDPIGKLKKTSTFDRAQHVDIGTSDKGKPVCFFREEGSSHNLSVGIGPDGAFIRVEYGDGPIAAEAIPKPPLQVFAGKEITKLVDGDLKSTGEYEPIQVYAGSVHYVPNLDTEYGGGFVVVAKADPKSFFEVVARAREEFVVVRSIVAPRNVDVIAIHNFKMSAIPALLACANKTIR